MSSQYGSCDGYRQAANREKIFVQVMGRSLKLLLVLLLLGHFYSVLSRFCGLFNRDTNRCIHTQTDTQTMLTVSNDYQVSRVSASRIVPPSKGDVYTYIYYV